MSLFNINDRKKRLASVECEVVHLRRQIDDILRHAIGYPTDKRVATPTSIFHSLLGIANNTSAQNLSIRGEIAEIRTDIDLILQHLGVQKETVAATPEQTKLTKSKNK